jgi:uncharacterized BrkB/YihY/UPF0761 family membrane protein
MVWENEKSGQADNGLWVCWLILIILMMGTLGFLGFLLMGFS